MDIGDSQENDIHYKLHNGMIPQIIDISIVQRSSENVSENVKFLQIIDLFKDLLIIFLSQFWKIARKKFERYSQNHHFIQRCLCRNFLKFVKKIIFPKSSIYSKISCIGQYVVKDIIKIIHFIKELLRIFLSIFRIRKISQNLEKET